MGYASGGSGSVEDPIEGLRSQFFVGGGAGRAWSSSSQERRIFPCETYVKRGGKFYHIAYEVENFQEAVRLFEAKN